MRRGPTRLGVLLLVAVLCPGGAGQAEPGGDAVPPEGPALPADVMTPTRHGFRLTPDLARIFSRRWIQEEFVRDVSLNERQEVELSRRMGERITDMMENHGDKMCDLIEFSIESMMQMRGRPFNAELSQQFAERTAELLPVVREFMRDFARDARPLLSDKQWEQLKDRLRRDFQRVDRLEGMMKRWADGDVKEGEDIFRALAEIEEDGDPENRGRSPRGMLELRRARRRAEEDLRRLSPSSWEAYVREAAAFFDFTAEQTAEARQLLATHRGQAEQLMTPSWRDRCRENRMKYHLRWSLVREPLAPWVYHLEQDYKELTAPLKEIEHEFCEHLIALATSEQRESGDQKLRERAEKHGMSLDSMDLQFLGLGRR